MVPWARPCVVRCWNAKASFGLKIAEWRLIAILAEATSLTPAALGERTRMDKITVSRAATALIDRGLITATDNPADGRSHLTVLDDLCKPQAILRKTAIFFLPAHYRPSADAHCTMHRELPSDEALISACQVARRRWRIPEGNTTQAKAGAPAPRQEASPGQYQRGVL